jgi:hypothetical protein
MHPTRPRLYYLKRSEDVSGNSGVGRVAEVAVFSNGTAVVQWTPDRNRLRVASTVVYQSVGDLLAVHGHDGRTTLEPMEG